MTQRESLPDNMILALYLAWRLARQDKTQAVIPHAALQRHLKKEKVHAKRIKVFANSLKPVFPHSLPAKEGYGLKNRLVLCLDKNDTEYNKEKALSFKAVPDLAAMREKLVL